MKNLILAFALLISLSAMAQDEKTSNVIAQAKNPLYVIDGLIKHNRDSIENKKLLFELNPDKIEKIEVLKGETASLLYGEEGKDGVVIITTKDFAKKFKIEKKP